MHEFKIGDWVKITNPDPELSYWFGITGFVTNIQSNSTTMMIFVEVVDPKEIRNLVSTVWFPKYLEYLGNEKMYVESVLGSDYFHG